MSAQICNTKLSDPMVLRMVISALPNHVFPVAFGFEGVVQLVNFKEYSDSKKERSDYFLN